MLELTRCLTDRGLSSRLGSLDVENLFVGIGIDLDGIPLAEFTREYFACNWIFDPLLNHPFQRAGAVGWIVTLLGQ